MNSIQEYKAKSIKTACGGTLKDPSVYPTAEFNGDKIYFCNPSCMKAFLESPEAFMSGEVEHPISEEEAQ